MGVGRFFCVALPLLLTIASIIAILTASLSGVVHNRLHVFTIDVEDLSIDPVDIKHLADKILGGDAGDKINDAKDKVEDGFNDVKDKAEDGFNDVKDKVDDGVKDIKDKVNDRRSNTIPELTVVLDTRADKSDNITAKTLGLGKKYEISLWGYCRIDHDGKRHCQKSRFDWASKSLGKEHIDDLTTDAGVKVDLPKEIKGSLKAFRELAKWTEVAFIIAIIALVLELVTGIFANCSRGVSCLTWVVASITASLVCTAAGLATAMAVVVVGAVKASAKIYGVKGSIGNQFLATVWIGAAFAIAAAFFWIFTICCCKPERRSRRDRHSSDGEKLLPSRGYAPLGSDNHHDSSGFYNPHQSSSFSPGFTNQARHPSGTGRSDLAYEPYSHRT